MAFQSLPWVHDRWMSAPPSVAFGLALGSVLLDAAADRVTFAGRFVHKDRTTKTVDGAGFLFGSVTKSNGSTFQCSLQDVDLTAGPPLREDGTADQTMTIANADAGFVSNAWYEAGFTGAATRSLTPGDLVAVVLQFASFVAGDTVNIRGLSALAAGSVSLQGACSANLSGTYAQQTIFPNVALRCSDGTYGTIEDGFVCSALNTHTFAVTTAVADEYALGVQYPVPVKIDGLWVFAGLTTATDVTEVLLYSGTTALATVTVDHNSVTNSAIRTLHEPCAEQTLAANTLYRLAIRPTGTNTMQAFSFDVAQVNHLQCHPGGTNAHLWTRVDQGAWGGEVTTRRLFAGVRVSALDDGASTGLARIIGG